MGMYGFVVDGEEEERCECPAYRRSGEVPARKKEKSTAEQFEERYEKSLRVRRTWDPGQGGRDGI